MPAATKTKYVYTGGYAHTLENGRPVAPAETVELTKDEVEENKDMIEEGKLVELKAGKEG